MSRRNIGYLNNNWKGGHRRDELGSVDLTEREILVVRVDTSKTVLASIADKGSVFYKDVLGRLDENEAALADYDMLNAVTDAQDIENLYDFTPIPSDMPMDFDFDTVQEIPFGEGF